MNSSSISVMADKQALKARSVIRLAMVTLIYITSILFIVLDNFTATSIMAIVLISLVYLLLSANLIACINFIKSKQPRILIDNEKLIIPKIFFVNRTRGILLSSIESIEFIKRGKGGLLIGVKNKYPIFIEGSLLSDRKDLEVIYDYLCKSVNGDICNEEKKNISSGLGNVNKTFVTYLFSIVLLLFFLLIYFHFVDNRIPEWIMKIGANSKDINSLSEVYKLFSSFFVHYNFSHFLINICGFLVIGRIMEFLVGRVRFANIILMSAVFGSLVSHFFSNFKYSMGASGGLFGLLGAYAVIKLCYKKKLPASLNTTPTKIFLIIMVVELVIGFVVDFIDGFAHIGGFICGSIMTYFMLREPTKGTLDLFGDNKSNSIPEYIVLSILCGIYLYGGLIFLTKLGLFK